MRNRAQFVKTYLKSARQAEKRKDLAVAGQLYSDALLSLLSIAVSEHADIESGTTFLNDAGTTDLLKECCSLHERVLLLISDAKLPESAIGGNFHLLTFVHMAWLLGDTDVPKKLTSIALADEVRVLSTTFWNEYAFAVNEIIHERVFNAPSITLHGQERYWYVYLEIIDALSKKRDLEPIVQHARVLFAERNRNKQIKDDNYQTEGSGYHQVQWDYRLESLLRFEGCK